MMTEGTVAPQSYLVVRDYIRVYDDPMQLLRGDAVTVLRRDQEYPGWVWCSNAADQSGWIHASLLEEEDYRYIALADYNAWELTVHKDDTLIGERELAGWLLATNRNGERGWVPLDHVSKI
jgi:Variant SH3 domain